MSNTTVGQKGDSISVVRVPRRRKRPAIVPLAAIITDGQGVYGAPWLTADELRELGAICLHEAEEMEKGK